MKILTIACLLLLGFTVTSATHGDMVDVFFITGQSNGGNVGELNSYDPQGYGGLNQSDANRSEQGFNLDFARIYDRTSAAANTGTDEVYHSFSNSQLDPAQFAVDKLAVNLNNIHNNDLGIYSFSRNGRPLYNSTTDGGESWFPGNDPANGDVFNDELYGEFSNWSSARIANLESAGHTVNVKGIFWFQGEGDVGIGDAATAEYEANFQRLVDRFRADFGSDLAVVATEIRVVGNAATQARQIQVNAGLASIAASDNLVSLVTTQDLEALSSGNVHFTSDAYYQLASRWSDSYSSIAVPEPNSAVLCTLMLVGAMARRRRV